MRFSAILKTLWNSDVAVLLRRLLIIYTALAVCRVIFYACNYDIIGPIGSLAEFFRLAKGALLFDSISILYVNAPFIILSLLPLRVREKGWYQKTLFWLFIVVNTLVMFLSLVDVFCFHYVQMRVTAADLIFLNNDNNGQLALRFAVENWYLVLAWIAIVFGMAWLYRCSGRPSTPIRGGWAYAGVSTLLLLGAVLVAVAVIRGGGFSRTIRPVTLSNAMSYTSSPAKATMILSNPFCVIRTKGNKGIKYKKYFPEEELYTIFSPYHYPVRNPAGEALASRKNVVLFILESFSAEHSALLNPDLYPDGEGYTPFLDSLMREGYYFTRAYATGRKSIDALPSMLGSMPSFKTPFVTIPQGMGEGMQLPKILGGEGYRTMFFNASPHGSMGFDAYANLAGITEIYDADDYNRRYPGNKDFDGYWGIWDEPFLGYMGEVLGGAGEPFFATCFTITSHHPFNVPGEYEDVLPAGTKPIHRPVAYTDMAVRRFFEANRDAAWMANTIFVFAGDHVSSERWAPKTETSVGRTHILSFVYTPDGSVRGCDGKVFAQTDVMPSILGMLGYARPYFAFGRDAFRESDRTPMAVNYYSSFQIITDEISMLYDEEKVLSAYAADDVLQKENIADPADPLQYETLKLLQAVIQQYYSHLEGRSYMVPLR